MLLPSTDTGLLTSHLEAHDGLISTVKMHLKEVENPFLHHLLSVKLKTMQSHVSVMLEMIDPDKNDFSEVPPLEELSNSTSSEEKKQKAATEMEIHLALQAKATTQSMAMDNFISALKMKNPEVKTAHVEMALQQMQLLKEVTTFLKENEAEVTPFSNPDEQRKVLEHFRHMRRE
ncbi:hypothetical protein BBI15_10710 [Planococcus plakortidis]|uniref:Spore coat protein n=1 Tax=Planococcus plakortidis TaxID=1038856 RepID=A0A1C7EAE5_9BACL|nr:hypothetical protein [Planococcus plakortidis]ANU20651.1 hypothetical protein BBI15_10710 [Planococcus plakortidis]